MSEEYRKIQIIDPNLFSGSTDSIRTSYGGYYQIISTDSGTEVEFSPMDVSGEAGFSVLSSGTPTSVNFTTLLQFAAATPIDTGVLTPNKKIPMRIFGNSDVVKTDLHWKTLLIGGDFGGNSHEPLYSNDIHSSFNVLYELPYTVTGSLVLANGDGPQVTMQLSYNYNNYLPLYQSYIEKVDSELVLPNIDIIYDLCLNSRNFEDPAVRGLYDEKFIDLITVEGHYGDCSNLLNYNSDNLPVHPFTTTSEIKIRENYPDIYRDNTNFSVEYLTSSYIEAPLSASTKAWANSKFKNILYDTKTVEQQFGAKYVNSTLRAPYGVYFEMPHYEGNLNDAGNWFLNSIKERHFDSRFIKSLYEVFGKHNYDIPIEPKEKEYIRYFNYLSGAIDTDSDSEIRTANNTTYREVDYMKLLSYCYNNYTSPSEESYFVGAHNLQRVSATDTSGIYRHINTEASLGAISDAVEFMSGNYIPFSSISDFFGEHLSYAEVLAYRVEKIGGRPTNDSGVQNTLQDFWFIKDANSKMFNFSDTQVKYDEDYTYKVYAYVIAGGYHYRYTDLSVSRYLGCTGSDGEYGLEMFDPYMRGEPRVPQIYSSSLPTVSDYNEDAAEPQILSNNRYVADVYLNYEPALKIIEIPIFSKTLKIQDNPINNIDVVPYQLIDDSQRIGFQMSFGTHLSREFPTTLSTGGDEYMRSYMHGRDYISDSKVLFESVSRPRYIEVYRLSERPTSIRDFDGGLIKTLDLAIENNTEYSYNAAHFDDTIETNKKYYYIMRALNQQRNIGHLSEIYEAQLINDGGYLYAMFNVLYHYEIEQEVFIEPTMSFKKVFQLQPNMNQIQLNTDGVDYSKSAAEQIENLTIGDVEDSIWGKQFKVRLTSKKTGRKIDLNITYNLNSD